MFFLARENRVKILKNLEDELNSKVITFITGDRSQASISIAGDILPIFHKLLFECEKPYENLSLFLYSRGGSAVTALSLISLIREHFKSFNVLIPFRAYSSATLIALGANSVYMCKTGELSPVDVSLTTPFNPLIDEKRSKNPGNFLPVNVEDLNGYVNFVKEELKIKDPSLLIKALKLLCGNINPLAIGALHRARMQNKQIAVTLLEYHMGDKKKIDDIAEKLTRGLYTHAFLLSKNDAKKLGLSIKLFEPKLEKMIMDLYFEYSNLLDLNIPFAAEIYLPYNCPEKEKEILLHRGITETLYKDELKSFTFQTKKYLKWIEAFDENIKAQVPSIIERDISNGWFDNNEV